MIFSNSTSEIYWILSKLMKHFDIVIFKKIMNEKRKLEDKEISEWYIEQGLRLSKLRIKDHKKLSISEKKWDLTKDISFGNSNITIQSLKDEGIYDRLCKKVPLTLKQVKGRERIILNKRNYQSLKKIFQNKSIPLWERQKFILLFSQNELLVAYGCKHVFTSSELR